MWHEVYYNGGALYKATDLSEHYGYISVNGVVIKSAVNGAGKIYEDLYAWSTGPTPACVSPNRQTRYFEDFHLLPNVDWRFVGTSIDGTTEFYFDADSADTIREVAAFYKLPVPIHDSDLAEYDPKNYATNTKEVGWVISSIKFSLDKQPILFKLYNYRGLPGRWQPKQRCRSFTGNAILYEELTLFTKYDVTLDTWSKSIVGERADGVVLQAMPIPPGRKHWEIQEIHLDTGVTRSKKVTPDDLYIAYDAANYEELHLGLLPSDVHQLSRQYGLSVPTYPSGFTPELIVHSIEFVERVATRFKVYTFENSSSGAAIQYPGDIEELRRNIPLLHSYTAICK